MFKKVKRFYELGLYTKEQVKMFVTKGVLTETEYEMIVGGKDDEAKTGKAD